MWYVKVEWRDTWFCFGPMTLGAMKDAVRYHAFRPYRRIRVFRALEYSNAL